MGARCGIVGPILLTLYFGVPAVAWWPYTGDADFLLQHAKTHELLFYAGGWLQATGTLLSGLFFLAVVQLTGRRDRFEGLLTRYADGWTWGNGLSGDGVAFGAKVAELRLACDQQSRDPGEVEVSCSVNVLVLPDQEAKRSLIEHVGTATGWPSAKVRDQYVIGTPRRGGAAPGARGRKRGHPHRLQSWR